MFSDRALVSFTSTEDEFFVAPLKYLGDQSASYQRVIQFRLGVWRQNTGASQPTLMSNPAGDLFIKGRSFVNPIYHVLGTEVASDVVDFFQDLKTYKVSCVDADVDVFVVCKFYMS